MELPMSKHIGIFEKNLKAWVKSQGISGRENSQIILPYLADRKCVHGMVCVNKMMVYPQIQPSQMSLEVSVMHV
jgi:hypothetical protein